MFSAHKLAFWNSTKPFRGYQTPAYQCYTKANTFVKPNVWILAHCNRTLLAWSCTYVNQIGKAHDGELHRVNTSAKSRYLQKLQVEEQIQTHFFLLRDQRQQDNMIRGSLLVTPSHFQEGIPAFCFFVLLSSEWTVS